MLCYQTLSHVHWFVRGSYYWAVWDVAEVRKRSSLFEICAELETENVFIVDISHYLKL